MAVVVAPEDEAKFIAAAQAENLEAYRVAVVTESPRMVMHWRGQTVADLSRAFLDTNGAVKHASIRVEAGKKQAESACAPCTLRDMAGSLKSASRRGLTERFDSTVGSFSLLMPFGGKTQRSPSQAMAALLPVLLGAMLHLVLCKTDYNSVDGIAKLLWQSGLLMESGGVLSATLAIMLVKLVKKTLAMILLAVLLVTCLMLAFRLTPAAVLEAVRSHERVPYEPEDDEEEVPPTRATATKSAEKSKACIDIPLDGETREQPKKEGKLSGFFTHKSDAVRTPDELLTLSLIHL